MTAVWKWRLDVTDHQTVSMPEGAQILSVQTQHEAPTLWALCNEAVPYEDRSIEIIGTGHNVPPAPSGTNRHFLGTFQLLDGGFVGHVFELRRV